jgi:hypothetical protein
MSLWGMMMSLWGIVMSLWSIVWRLTRVKNKQLNPFYNEAVTSKVNGSEYLLNAL